MNKRQKILIVDDAKFNRDILKEFLGETYDYLEAENGNQAVQIMEENPGIDLMLLDINMPQMDGFEVLHINPSLFISKQRTDNPEGQVTYPINIGRLGYLPALT